MAHAGGGSRGRGRSQHHFSHFPPRPAQCPPPPSSVLPFSPGSGFLPTQPQRGVGEFALLSRIQQLSQILPTLLAAHPALSLSRPRLFLTPFSSASSFSGRCSARLLASRFRPWLAPLLHAVDLCRGQPPPCSEQFTRHLLAWRLTSEGKKTGLAFLAQQRFHLLEFLLLVRVPSLKAFPSLSAQIRLRSSIPVCLLKSSLPHRPLRAEKEFGLR